jgi:nicotinamide mononucleotide transporter
MQAKRWYESWFLWIIADIIYVPMFFLGDQPITAALYLVFIFLAIFGLLEWKKAIKKAS